MNKVPTWVWVVGIILVILFVLSITHSSNDPADQTDGSPTCYEYGC